MDTIIYAAKAAFKYIFAFLATLLLPHLEAIVILFFAHFVDLISALRLNHRLHRKDPEKFEPLRLKSAGIKKLVGSLGMEALIIVLFILIHHYLIPSIPIVTYIIWVMIGSQLLSVIENEATESDSKWAIFLSKLIKSKAVRYLADKTGLSKEDLDDIIK